MSRGLSNGYVVSRDRFDLGLVQLCLNSGPLPVFMVQDQQNAWGIEAVLGDRGNQYPADNQQGRGMSGDRDVTQLLV